MKKRDHYRNKAPSNHKSKWRSILEKVLKKGESDDAQSMRRLKNLTLGELRLHAQDLGVENFDRRSRIDLLGRIMDFQKNVSSSEIKKQYLDRLEEEAKKRERIQDHEHERKRLRVEKQDRLKKEKEAREESIKRELREKSQQYLEVALKYERSGNYDATIELLRKSVELDPRNVKASQLLSSIFSQLGYENDAKLLLGQVAVHEEGIFTEHVRDHIKRIKAIGEPYISFVKEYLSEEVISMLAGVAVEKMSLTQEDNSEHGYVISNAPICYQICTLSMSTNEAKEWFIGAYGGYTRLLERSWNAEYFRSTGCEVLIHIVYARENDHVWINMAVVPINSRSFTFSPIMPIDLLTDIEKRI